MNKIVLVAFYIILITLGLNTYFLIYYTKVHHHYAKA
jgi:hypothetical protein